MCILPPGLFVVHVSVFRLKDNVCIVLTMNIFMFSVSLLLAFHHVHLHHLCSILHFEQCWLANWKVGELKWRYWIGTINLQHIPWKIRCVCVEKPCGCGSMNLHPVLCAVCVPASSLSAKQILPWAGTVLLLSLKHEWPSSHLHGGCDSVASAA